jgi:purine-binding chemotaxis protein CheW
MLGSESCAIPVHRVREIVRFPAFPAGGPTSGPVEGIINLRGRRIPVLDLRVAFGFPAAPATARTCIVVVQLTSPAAESQFTGLLVDAVEEIIHLTGDEIGQVVPSQSRLDGACLLGMARVEGAVKGLLDIDRAVARAMVAPVQQRRRESRSRSPES